MLHNKTLAAEEACAQALLEENAHIDAAFHGQKGALLRHNGPLRGDLHRQDLTRHGGRKGDHTGALGGIGAAEQGLACDGSPLSGEETDLIAMYRLLPCYVREDIFELIFFHYKKHVEKKKESIYWTYAADREEKSDPGEDESTSGIA